jgi:excisionase family DNA binding protein
LRDATTTSGRRPASLFLRRVGKDEPHMSKIPNPRPDQEPLAYRIRDAARLLSLSERTVWQLIKSGELPARRIGRAILVTRTAIEEFLDSSEGGSCHTPGKSAG